MAHLKFETLRTVDPLAPPSSIGYDIGNCVALLFDRIAHENLDPARADLSTLTVQYVEDHGVKASIYVEDPRVDMLNLTL